MASYSVLTGSRIVIEKENEGEFVCTACGDSLRGQREVVAVPRHGIHSPGITTFSLVHNKPTCIFVVT